MADRAGAANSYALVLADLRKRRDEIDNAIRVLLRVSGETPTVEGELAQQVGADVPPPPLQDEGAYLGMSIPDAAKKLLQSRRTKMGNAEIAAALQAGGLILRSAEPSNTVGSVLTRRFNMVGDIVRAGRGQWGLKEWFPHQNFRRRVAAKGEIPTDSDGTVADTRNGDDLQDANEREAN